MTLQEQIEAKLIDALSPSQMELENQSHLHAGHAGSPGSGDSHWHLTIKSEALDGLSRVAKHRKVYEILAEEIAGPIHALSFTFL